MYMYISTNVYLSLLSRRIWLESEIEYDNMRRRRASYHYLLRSMKSKKRMFMLNNLCQKRCFSPAKGIIGKVLLLFARKITILFHLLIILEVMPPLLIFLKINTLRFLIVFLFLAIQCRHYTREYAVKLPVNALHV